MPGALNSLLRQGPPETPAGGPRPTGGAIPVQPVAPPPGPAPAAPTSAPAPSPNALASLLQGGAGPGQLPQRPTPNHQQTVAALVHLQAVQKAMDGLSRLPGLGKENIRPEIFDATADLMGQGMFTLPQVMNEIKAIPADPPGQKQWVLQHLQQISAAQKQILMDHAQGNPGSGDFATEMANLPAGDDSGSHVDTMKSVVDHYSTRRR